MNEKGLPGNHSRQALLLVFALLYFAENAATADASSSLMSKTV